MYNILSITKGFVQVILTDQSAQKKGFHFKQEKLKE